MLKLILKIALGIILLVVLGVGGLLTYLKTAFPKIGPAEDITIEITPERLERGKYIANNVAVCMNCHSTRDWSLLAGPVVEGTHGIGGEVFNQKYGFPGYFTSKNITPAGIGDWTDGDIFRAVTAGVSRDGSALFPIMQYLAYGTLDREDMYAVIAYIKSIPAVESNPLPSKADFPMNFIINTIPTEPEFTKRPDTSDIVAYGKYVATMAACIECHTQAVKGEKLPGMDFAGGFEFKLPGVTVYSRNITPHESAGIGDWEKEVFINQFKAYSDSDYVSPAVAEGEFNTIMPWTSYSGMTEFDLGAIYEYLRTVPPVDYTPPNPKLGT